MWRISTICTFEKVVVFDAFLDVKREPLAPNIGVFLMFFRSCFSCFFESDLKNLLLFTTFASLFGFRTFLFLYGFLLVFLKALSGPCGERF